MNKKRRGLLILTMLLALVIIICTFASCNDNEPSSDPGTDPGTDPEIVTTDEPCESHTFNDGVVVKESTCAEKGTMKYTCKVCGATEEKDIALLEHTFDEGTVTLEPTLNTEGTTLYTCQKCGAVKEEPIAMLPCAYTITMEGIGEFHMAEDGIYELQTPTKAGYEFVKWVDGEGNDFPASGVIKKNITVKAVWNLLDTKTIAELEERAAAGAADIRLVNDIVIDRPIFFTGETNLFANGSVKLTRAPGYAGDLFVVGEDKDGTPSVVNGKQTILNIGGNNGTVTIDGNKSNVTVDVVGSAIFVCGSSTVNILDGTNISNHNKVGNERMFTYDYSLSKDRVGGAAIAIINGTVKMYGGTISNNSVRNTYTEVENEDGSTSNLEVAACGGAIYSVGSFYMYGGTITGNEALRGGAIYNGGMVYLEAGTISYNLAHAYGGAVSSSSSASANTFIGTSTANADDIIFSNNHCAASGGALYSATNSPILISGNAQFNDNKADGSGGAIYASSGLTIRDASFDGNTSESSGGAIYYCYTAADRDPRKMELTDCTFENNEAKTFGGAVILSAADAVFETKDGAIADISGCTFRGNESTSNGGALYVTRNSEAYIKDSVFTLNTSAGHGGALFVSGAHVEISENTEFTQNTSTGNGGAVYVGEHTRPVEKENGEKEQIITKSSVTVNDTSFEENSAAQGGALYVSKNQYTLNNVTFDSNEATKEDYGGGAIYCTESEGTLANITFTNNTSHKGGAVALHTNSSMTVSSMTATGNSATANTEGKLGVGGVFYVINSTLSLTEGENKTIVVGGEDNLGNTAVYGGAIHATNSVINISGASFIGNSSATNGGAIYATTSTLNCSDSEFKNNAATGNVSDSQGHGGAIYLSATKATLTGKNLFEENTATNHAGAIYLTYVNVSEGKDGATLTMTGGTFLNNSALGGGAVSIRTDCEASFDGTSFVGNSVTGALDSNNGDGEGGGAIYIGYGKQLALTNCIFDGNIATGGYGGAINCLTAPLSIVDGEFNNNSATYGGAIRMRDGALSYESVTFYKNSATNGGAIHISGGTLDISDSDFTENSATLGGAIYIYNSTLTCSASEFKKNTATNNGGAIDLVATEATFTGNNLFEGNTAANHGGAIYVNHNVINNVDIGSTLTMTGGKFLNNSAMAGGAVSIRTLGDASFDGTTFEGNTVAEFVETEDQKLDGNGEGGGAIYVGYGELDLTDCIFTENSSDYGYGGAIDICDSTVTIVRGSFTGNFATTAGGAINIITSSDVTVNGVIFTSNKVGNETVTADGGAIYSKNSALTITGSTFNSNSSTQHGGAIYASKTTLECTNSTFSANSSSNNGGAIYVISSTDFKVSGSKFTSNRAYDGGAIYVYTSTMSCAGSIFTENESRNHGAAIDLVATEATLTGNNLFEKNTAGKHGGAIYVMYMSVGEGEDKVNTGSTLTMTGGTFLNNSALGGGAVSIRSDCEASFDGTSFIGNTVQGYDNTNNGDGEGGGAIYMGYGKQLTLTNCIFDGNTATGGYGGAVNCLGASLGVVGGEFKNNSASYGGAIRTQNGTLGCEDATFYKNSATTHGGAIHMSGTAATLTENNVFEENTATEHGGAIYVSYTTAANGEKVGGTITMTGGEFKNNSATGGGAVSLRTNCEGSFNGTSFIGNSVTGFKDDALDGNAEGGGAIYIGGGKQLTVTNCIFDGNTADGSFGGAINCLNSPLNVVGGEFKNNTAASGGAVSSTSGGKLTFNGVKFTANKATATHRQGVKNGGGAIYVVSGELTVVGGTFDGNTTGYYGGALAAYSTKVNISEGAKLSGNKGATGAALYFNGCSNVTMDTVTLENNQATGNGVVYFNSGTNVLTNITATGNKSNKGGVFYASGGTLTINDSKLNGNFATEDGGAIHVSGGSTKVTVNNTEMKDNGGKTNSADKKFMGGAIFVTENNNLKLEDCTITGNYADLGGGIYANNVEYTATDCTIENNTSTTEGAENEYTAS